MLAAPEDGRAVAAITKLIGKEIPFSVIPGIDVAELEYDQRRGRGARGAARPDNRRPARTRDTDRRPALAESRPPRRERRPRTINVPLPSGDGSNGMLYPIAAQTHRTRPHDERKGQEPPKVVGFGDDLPAFLSRAPRIVARP